MRFLLFVPLLAATLPAQEPAVFSLGTIADDTNELSPAFAPDCRTVLYTVGNGVQNMIVISRFVNGKWTPPAVAEFSGHWRDLEASMAPDGSYLVFASNRPASDSGAPLDGNYNGKVQPGRGGNLWRVDRRGSAWGKPVRLPDAINANTSIFSPSVVADGSLYFMKPSPDSGHFQLFRSQRKNGQYRAAERVSFSDEQWTNVDAAVAPDESFMIFSSSRPPTADKDLDLFIAFRTNGVWGEPKSLGPHVNSPSGEIEARLSPDTRTLFFSSRRNGGATQIFDADLSPWVPGKSGYCSPVH